MHEAEPSPIVLTIVHSTRMLEGFIGLLRAHGATRVVDVRTVPRSRHNPQFDEASLPGSLKEAGFGSARIPIGRSIRSEMEERRTTSGLDGICSWISGARRSIPMT